MRKIFLVTLLTLALACTACSNSKKTMDNTPDTANPENTSVTKAPKEEESEKEEALTDKEQKTSLDDDSKAQESSMDELASNVQILDDLSDDLSSFQIQIDDVIYSFPMKYSDFVAFGFVMKDDDSQKLEPGYYTWSYFNRGDFKVIADIINADDKEQPISECYIGSIEIEKDYKDSTKGMFIALPKGIIFEKSTLEDVKAAYGEPSRLYEGPLYTKLSYDYELYQKVEIEIGTESGVVDSIIVRNMNME